MKSVIVTDTAPPHLFSGKCPKFIITKSSLSRTSHLSLLVSSLVFLVFQVVIMEGFNTTGRRLTATRLYEVQMGLSSTSCLPQALCVRMWYNRLVFFSLWVFVSSFYFSGWNLPPSCELANSFLQRARQQILNVCLYHYSASSHRPLVNKRNLHLKNSGGGAHL